MTAPATYTDLAQASASSTSYDSESNGYSDTIHKMVNLYPFFYKYSASTSYQLNPDYIVHYVSLDAGSGGGHTLTMTLPYLSAFPNGSCLFVVYLRNTHINDVLRFATVDATCSINSLADNTPFDFTTDANDHLFFVYGNYRPGAGGNYINKYFIKSMQGREIEINAGTGISVARANNVFTISAFAGVPIGVPISPTAVTTAEHWGPLGSTTIAGGAWIMPQAGTISRLYYIGNQTTVPGNQLTVTVTIDGVDTALTVAVPHGSTIGSDLTHTVVVSPEDQIQFKTTQSITGEALEGNVAFLFKPSAV